MTPNKEDIKNWLKSINENRFWLADQCRVSKSTVDNWLSSGIEIPYKVLLIIKSLMEKGATRDTEPNSESEDESDLEFTLEFNGETAEMIEKFMEHNPEINLEDYAQMKIIEFCAGVEKAKANARQLNPTTIIEGRGDKSEAS